LLYNNKKILPQESTSCQVKESTSFFPTSFFRERVKFLSNAVSEVCNAKVVTLGQTIICPFKALRHPTAIIRNCAFGPNSVFYVLHIL